jgi:hypothetical protein
MSTNRLYHTWLQRICELRPAQRITQVRNFVWLMIGIYESRSVTLSKIACKIPGSALLLSTVKRLSRFLENPAIRVRSGMSRWPGSGCSPRQSVWERSG